MKKGAWIIAFVALFSLSACFHSELDACLAAPTYRCLMDQAEKTANGIDSELRRFNAFAYIVRVAAATGQQEEGRKYLAILEQSTTDNGRLDMTSGYAVRAYAAMNQLDRATEYAARITVPYQAGLAYAWLAGNQARLGDYMGARQSIDRADSLTRKLDAGERSAVLSWIAVAEAATGERRRASEVAEAARDIALSQAVPYHQVRVLATGAVALSEAGYRNEALEYLLAASNVVQSVKDASSVMQRGSSLAFLAWAQAVIGETQPARLTLAELLKLIPDMRHPFGRSILLAAAAMTLAYVESRTVDNASHYPIQPLANFSYRSCPGCPVQVFSG